MKRRRVRIDNGLVILLLIVVVVAVASVFLALELRTNEVAEAIQEHRTISVAVLVNDGEKLICTEILIYDPTTSKAAVFDIPGEWGDVIESLGRMERIDVLYREESPAEYVSRIETLLDLAIPWHIEMDLSEVESVVDLLGGLELFIANPVEVISDVDAVLLPSGSLVLDGAKIVQYLSYSDDNEADLERRARYQKFVQAFLSRIGSEQDLLTRDEVFTTFSGVMSTNLSKRALRSFAEEIEKIDTDYMVPKHVRGERVLVDDQKLLFPHFEGNLIRESIRQTLESLANLEVVGDSELTVVVDVRNGTEVSGLASRTAQLLGDFGYDVLPPSNADRADYERTIIIGYSEDISKAQQIANLLRCSQVERAQSVAAQPLAIDARAHVTVVLGQDFDGRYCKE